ncbi:MAG: acyl-CoA thioesterase [Treponema sp.]|nr:acyl-CoA thioesterase [Treponema sp.]
MKPYIHKINYYETDKMSITHHSNYIRFMEEARLDFMDQLGWGYDKMEEIGIISPVVSVTCNYKKTTTFPNVLSISVSVAKCSAVKLTLCYTMKCGDDTVCTAESSHCFLDPEGKPVILEKQFPEFYAKLKEIEAVKK